jgi:hypothetical protein
MLGCCLHRAICAPPFTACISCMPPHNFPLARTTYALPLAPTHLHPAICYWHESRAPCYLYLATCTPLLAAGASHSTCSIGGEMHLAAMRTGGTRLGCFGELNLVLGHLSSPIPTLKYQLPSHPWALRVRTAGNHSYSGGAESPSLTRHVS